MRPDFYPVAAGQKAAHDAGWVHLLADQPHGALEVLLRGAGVQGARALVPRRQIRPCSRSARPSASEIYV